MLQIEIVNDGDIVTNNDLEEVTFVDFPLTDEKEITKCNKNVKENMKKCSHCSFETKKTSNLKRHVQRFHGPDLVKNVQPKQGFCLRFECGQTFHRIRDLQRHLISSRNHKLHFETKAFNSFQVNCLIQYFSFKPSARQHFFHFTKRVLGKFSPGQSPPGEFLPIKWVLISCPTQT